MKWIIALLVVWLSVKCLAYYCSTKAIVKICADKGMRIEKKEIEKASMQAAKEILSSPIKALRK